MAAAAEEATPIEKTPKLNADGTYQTFRGLTVVCDMIGSDSGALATLGATLRALPTLGPIMSPLPPASYHVTVFGVCEQHTTNDGAWAANLADPRWTSASRDIEQANFVPQLRVKSVNSWPGGISVLLQPADDSTPDSAGGVPDMKRIARSLGVEASHHPWHFTLGYCVSRERYQTAERVAIECDEAAMAVAVLKALPGEVPLGPARFCRYDDMTKFTPWPRDSGVTQ
mmetsp:Transcript_9437/g.24334  ORF Transcript_9437/g.24334 Transcript_9437/m.24334 type:complete len:228 (-) Transcript_9437:114-797(-)